MAKINTNTIKITASKLLKDSDPAQPLIDAELAQQLEAVIQELLGAGVLIETEIEC